MTASLVVYLSFMMILVGYTVEGVARSRSGTRKRSFDDDFHLGNKQKEEEIMNMHLNANRYSNLTYREEYCKAKNWSIEFGW